ncbi:hypothetical protein [Streptomyces heilongjiangensis]|uniref:Peptide zinc metalloprotease protein n=1 Tax=Streptomyces heilongjiangensis TaxID=945052 RepID=A0ABW1B8X4_9ACTN|nr:hypothetical protein [Streptomyces heilongjiangensis]MDC2951595.1 hypothetical protein [Streptomyces heilongjiangensis]
MTEDLVTSLGTASVPRLGPGLETLGEYQGSGLTERKYIVRRGDGQVLMLSRLLYLIVCAVDGVRDAEAISHRVSGRYGAEVTAQNVLYLLDERLAPLGVTLPLNGSAQESAPPTLDLLLSLRGHRVIFREAQVARIAAAFAWLHRPVVVALALTGMVAMDVWLFAFHGAITPVLQVLEQPLWMLIVFALTVASLLFHEFGHASACHYSGAVPGKIGYGLYLIWPSMYTDVTDVYRITKAGRLRTGLGGVYFNAVFMLFLLAGYLLTGEAFFLASIYLVHFEVLEQLMPVVRLDGYYILSDLAGVPDLFGKVKPILRSMLPGRKSSALGLKRSARTVVTVWVLTMIPLLVAEVAYVLWNLPRLVATAARSLGNQCAGTYLAFSEGHPAAGAVGVIGTLMLMVPMAGGAYLACRVAARLYRAVMKATEGKPARRLTLAVAAGVGAVILAGAWWHGMTPKPLPAAAPVTPALQPTVPWAQPTPSTSADSGPTGRPTPSPPGGQLTDERPSTGLPGGRDTGRSTSGSGTSPSPARSASPSAAAPTTTGTSAPGSARPTRRPTRPTAAASGSGTPSAVPSSTATGPVTESPSPSATEPPSPSSS